MSPSVVLSTDVLFGVLLLYGIFKGAPSLYFKSLLEAAKLSVCGKGPQNISAIEAVMKSRRSKDGWRWRRFEGTGNDYFIDVVYFRLVVAVFLSSKTLFLISLDPGND